MEGEASVKVEGLSKSFGDFKAVDRISFEVRPGTVFGFLGPNGAGKSTTIKMLCGLLLPSGGRGIVGGHDIVTGTEEIKKNIGYMSQRFSLYDDLTVEENINFFSGIYGVSPKRRRERKEAVLEMSGLAGRRGSVTKTLSGGFKQRLALGCAILHEPGIIFLDEPTSGVDPIARRNFWDLIYGMSRAGKTVFVTTHYMDEAEYCDRLALIYGGRIIADGTPGELKRNRMKKKVVEIEVDRVFEAVDVLENNGIDTAVFASLLHATVESADAPAIGRIESALKDAGIGVKGIGEIAPTLEDVFVTLIGAS